MHLVQTPTSTKRGHAVHPVPDTPESPLWLAQSAILAIHMWSSREHHLDEPDWVVFDLDPVEKFAEIVAVAEALRRLLDEMSLPCLPKTTGKRGLHVLVPLAPGHSHEEAHQFAVSVGKSLMTVLPQATMERRLEKRHGRIYFDCHQNGYGKTIIAPYSLRGAAGAPVSAPLEWDEVSEKLQPASFNIRTMPARVDKLGDRFADFMKHAVRLPRLA